jgi:hypothetical protein
LNAIIIKRLKVIEGDYKEEFHRELVMIVLGFGHQQDTGGGVTLIHIDGTVWGCQHMGQVVQVYVNIES